MLLCGVVWLSKKLNQAVPQPSETAPAPAVAAVKSAPLAPLIVTRPPPRAASNDPIKLVKAQPTEAEIQAHSEFVENRISQLNDLAMSGDPTSLQEILNELDNPEPRIRNAAIEAAVQFRSPAAIPALQDAEQQATDVNEKAKIQQAIEFLGLTMQAQQANTNQ
jgi:hypothetical protein